MELTRGELAIAAAVVFGALCLAIASPLLWVDPRSVKPDGNYWHDIARPREQVLLTEYSAIVQRDDLTLRVQLIDGGALNYQDDKDAHDYQCGLGSDQTTDHCIVYSAWEISSDRRYVTLWVGYYEGSSGLLIDRATGAALRLAKPPHRAPDGRHWAVVDSDTENPTAEIDVVENAPDKPQIIASEVHSLCRFERWESDAAFLMTCAEDGTDTKIRVTWDEAGKITEQPTEADPSN